MTTFQEALTKALREPKTREGKKTRLAFQRSIVTVNTKVVKMTPARLYRSEGK